MLKLKSKIDNFFFSGCVWNSKQRRIPGSIQINLCSQVSSRKSGSQRQIVTTRSHRSSLLSWEKFASFQCWSELQQFNPNLHWRKSCSFHGQSAKSAFEMCPKLGTNQGPCSYYSSWTFILWQAGSKEASSNGPTAFSKSYIQLKWKLVDWFGKVSIAAQFWTCSSFPYSLLIDITLYYYALPDEL